MQIADVLFDRISVANDWQEAIAALFRAADGPCQSF